MNLNGKVTGRLSDRLRQVGIVLVLLLGLVNLVFGDSFPFDSASYFSEGLVAVRIGGDAGKYGWIDKTGKYVINPQFDYATGFLEGLACVRIGDRNTGKYGYIDKTGKYVIKPQFDHATKLFEGLARVMIGDDKTGFKYGYIDKTGKLLKLTYLR